SAGVAKRVFRFTSAGQLSRDGRFVVLADARGRVWRHELTSGRASLVVETGTADISVRTVRDDEIVALTPDAVWRCPVAKACREVWRRHGDPPLGNMAHSPDGRWVAAAGVDGSLHLFDLQTETARLLPGHRGEVHALAFSLDSRQLATAGIDKD